MSIKYVTGDATRPEGEGSKIIVHVCNDLGAWGAGFVLALSKRWKGPEEQYRQWAKGELTIAPPFALGNVQFVHVTGTEWVANLIGQEGFGEPGRPPVRYLAIGKGLERVAKEALAREASVHMPRIGCGLAGGKWEVIEALI